MASSLQISIENLCSPELGIRESAAREIFRLGRAPADRAIHTWWNDAELSSLLRSSPEVTVGIAVHRERFAAILAANNSPRLADVPPDQDAREFELHFSDNIRLDILTTREPGGSGAIAKFLEKFGEGVQQVEFLCDDVDRATQILKDKFGVTAIYPATRPGADGTRVNFFLVASPGGSKVLIELYEPPSS